MKPIFFTKLSLAFANIAIALSFHFAGAQTLYTPGGTIGKSANTNIGVNITSPLSPLHLIGDFRLGIDYQTVNRAKSILKFGDADYVKIGEWEQDDKMSFFADKGYHFTGGPLTLNSNLYCKTIISFSTDFILGMNDTRPQGIKLSQRALVHAPSTTDDILILNYDGDFENGVEVQSDLRVTGQVNVGSVNFKNVSGSQIDMSGSLRVTGKIATTEVCVTPNAVWCDYVFEKDYKLMPLKDLGKYVTENKHLPEIPTTAEVAKSGVNIGEINVLYLKKIEELTLYVLQQQKQLELQQKQLETQQAQINSLKASLK
jgi:hypothetical protein